MAPRVWGTRQGYPRPPVVLLPAAVLSDRAESPPNLPTFVPEDRYSLEAYLAIEAATGKR